MILAALTVLMTAVAARAESSQTVAAPIELIGLAANPIQLTPGKLAEFPAVEKQVSFKTSKGMSSGLYKGVLMWDVLKSNGLLDGVGHNEELKKTFVVTGSDGYRIAFSIGEISPDFGDSPMMIVLEVDGKPVADRLRIVVPGDMRGARNVRDVVKIEIH